MTRSPNDIHTDRLRRTHDNSPRGYNWHARRLFGPDVDPDRLTREQWEQVAAERLTWLRAKSANATIARRLNTVRRLREKADRIEADVLRGEPA